MNADRWAGSFGLNRAFFVIQIFTLRIEMLFPCGLVVGSDVGDREAVERATLGHCHAGLFFCLVPAVDNRCLGSLEAIGSLGVYPFAS